MKKTLLALGIFWTSLSFAQLKLQVAVKGYGDKIIIGYYKDFVYIMDTVQLKKDKVVVNFDSAEPVYFKLQTMAPDTYTPFFIGFPGDTIFIEKDEHQLTIKGGAEKYNTFLSQVGAQMRAEFAGKPMDYKLSSKYLLDRSEAFFLNFNHPQKQLIEDIHYLFIVANYELLPDIVKYSADAGRMKELSNAIRDQKGTGPTDDDLIKHLAKIDFKNPNIVFGNIPETHNMNNLIRILRIHAVNEDSTLKEVDEYVVENKIIKDLFKESPYRSKLLAYNLYNRITQYTQYPMQLAGVNNFVADFRSENFNTNFLPIIEKIYSREVATIGSLSKGVKAPAFKLHDTKGRMISLADFKGKVVYLDLWATWCGPCLKEMPYMKPLKEKFKNKAVELVAISIDTDPSAWLKKIAAMNLEGVQLIDNQGSTNSKIAKDYKIHGVPHYVLIDKEGKIASAFAPRPSETILVEAAINSLLE